MKHSIKTPWFLSNTFFGIFFVFVFVCIIFEWFIMGYGIYSLISAGPEGIGKAIGEAVKAYKDTAQ